MAAEGSHRPIQHPNSSVFIRFGGFGFREREHRTAARPHAERNALAYHPFFRYAHRRRLDGKTDAFSDVFQMKKWKRRYYVKHPGPNWTEYAECDDWRLYWSPGADGWTNYRLLSRKAIKKRVSFWLGWNGERFALSHDLQDLQRIHPGALEWVRGQLRAKAAPAQHA